jgi:hypothetical protein
MQKFIPKVTIDHNSIVALHKRDAGLQLSPKDSEIATAMDGMIKLAQIGDIEFVMPAIAANERQQKGQQIGNFEEFVKRVEKLRIKPAIYSLPEMRTDMSYMGHATIGFSGPEWYVLLREIQQIIHPAMDWDDTEHKNWLNRYCDVSTMFAHLEANADIFVSDDNIFHSAGKKADLLALGANMIATAKEALEALNKQTVRTSTPLDLPKFDDTKEKRCSYIPANSYHHYRAFRQEKGFKAL